MNLLEKLLIYSGTTKVPLFAREEFGFRAVVQYTSEFRRIEALPRRGDLLTSSFIPELCESISEILKLPTGSMRLWATQAAALYEIEKNRGGFLSIGVGQGKALISLLAPVVLQAERPVLFVPAALRDQTRQHVIPQMRKHWKLHPDLQIYGYEELSLEKNAHLLEQLNPDVIILDETHRVKTRKAGRTRRLVRWFRDHPETCCVALSGTMTKRSLLDFAHVLNWCLKGGSPLPSGRNELQLWADALDEKVSDEQRVAPGALLRFCDSVLADKNPRVGFRKRLVETSGVVATQEDALGVSLRIEELPVIVPAKILDAAERMKKIWSTPDGYEFADSIELWRHLREIYLGFWYRWRVPAPKPWLEARSAWARYVRATLSRSRTIDTEYQVYRQCLERGDVRELDEWTKVKDSFAPDTEAVWLDNFLLGECWRWMCRQNAGIVWYEHREFGRQLAALTRRPLFGAGDSGILSTTAPVIIVSQNAHREGKNLQDRYSANLVVSPPTSGEVWEQVLGRTHRPGQQADEVTCAVYLGGEVHREAFAQARADARYEEDLMGNRQKLNYADMVNL